jgi:hypothetical protein
MNVDQINEGEVRVFPFYKGKYMGKVMLGFSNEKSAKAYMKNIPEECVYERFGGEKAYIESHEYVNGLDENKLHTFYHVESREDERRYGQNPEIDGIYTYDDNKMVYLKDLDTELVKNMRNDEKKIKNYYNFSERDKIREFEEKYGFFRRFMFTVLIILKKKNA